MAATIRKFVKVKPFKADTQPGRNLNTIRLGVNRLGTLTDGIQASVKETATLIKFEKEYLKKDTKEDTKESKNEIREKKTLFERDRKKVKRLFKKKKRDQREKESELGVEEGEKEAQKQIRKQDKPIKGLLGFLGSLLGTVFKYFITFAAIDWLSDPKNGKRLEAVIKLLFTIGKFAYNITKLGVGLLFDGITNLVSAFQEGNAVSRVFNFFKGALQILGGVAALRTAQYMIMPWKVLKDIRLLRSLFSGVGEAQAEADHSEKVRRTGYRDKKTGVIYSEEEYKQMQKSAQRADAKRGAKAGKGMKSDLYSTEFENRFVSQMERKQKGPFQKMRQRSRIAGKKLNKGFGKVAGKLGGKLNVGMSVIGGAGRIASGLASGESAGKAVGAGVGQAAGGLIGGIAGTALLGPFLGPFAPIVGNAIGSFLGEWVGGELGPIMEPIFKPIQRYFGMVFDLLKSVFSPIIDSLGEVFSAFFDVVGELAGVLFKAAQILGEFVGFVLGPIFDGIGKVVNFVVSQAKRLMDPGSMAAGFFDAITFNLFDADGYNKKAAGGEVKAPPSRAAGGDTTYTDGATGMLRTTGGVLLNTMVGSFGMFGPAGANVKQAMSGDIARLSQTFGVASGGSGSTGSASITRSGGTDVDFGSSSKEGEADRALQKSSAIHNKLISGFESFNKLLVDGIRVFNPEYMTEDSGQGNAPGAGSTPASSNNVARSSGPPSLGSTDVQANIQAILKAADEMNYTGDKAAILAIAKGESGIKGIPEQPITSAQRASEVWPPPAGFTVAEAQSLLDKGGWRALYNEAYGWKGNSLGNRPGTNDGSDFIGRGFIQITGRHNYKDIGDRIGVDFMSNPDALLDKDIAAKATIAFMQRGGSPKDMESALRAVGGIEEGWPKKRRYYADFNQLASQGKLKLASAGGKIILEMDAGGEVDKDGRSKDPKMLKRLETYKQGVRDGIAKMAAGGELDKLDFAKGARKANSKRGMCVAGVIYTAEANGALMGAPEVSGGVDPNNHPRGLMSWAVKKGYGSIPGTKGKPRNIKGPFGTFGVTSMTETEWADAVVDGLIPNGSLIFNTRHGWDWNGGSSGNDAAIAQDGGARLWSGHWQYDFKHKGKTVGAVYNDVKEIVALTHPSGNTQAHDGLSSSGDNTSSDSDSGGNNAGGSQTPAATPSPKPVTVDSMVESTVGGLKKLIEIFGGDASAFGPVTSDPDRGSDAPVDKRITPGAVTKTDETGATVKANPPGALAPGQRPDIALTSAQLKVSKKARKEADALGLTGMEKEKYVAGRVMGTIADPGITEASNTRSAMVSKMRALDDKAKRQTDAEMAGPMILETPVPVPTPQAGSLNSGGGSTPVVIRTSPSPMLTGKQ